MASFSSICRLEGCKRKALLSMVCGRFREKTDALVFGTAFHESIEKTLEDGIAVLRMNNLHSQIDLLTEMNLRQKLFMLNNNIEIIANEVPFEITLNGIEESFRGYIDAIVMWNGEPWLAEFKTARYIDVGHVPIDSQITAYLWACRETGIAEPKGVLYMVNQKSMTKAPIVLANGHLSTAKNQGCLFGDYADKALEIYGEDIPAKVELFMEWLALNEQPKLVMVPATRTKEQLDAFGKYVMEYAKTEQHLKELLKEKGATDAIRAVPCFPTKHCFQNCDFKDQCKKIILDETLEFAALTREDYDNIFNVDKPDI